MAKRLSPKQEPQEISFSSGAEKNSQAGKKRYLAILKFILGIIMLPFVYTTTISFIGQFSRLSSSLQKDFLAGVITFLVTYLFLWEPTVIFASGQRILEFVFFFFKTFVKIAPQLIPIYALISFLAYAMAYFLGWEGKKFFILLAGFSMALHLVFSAKTIRTKQGDFLKANYLFGFSFIYIINIFFLAFCFNLLSSDFSFVEFVNYAYLKGQDIFLAVFRQLFVVGR